MIISLDLLHNLFVITVSAILVLIAFFDFLYYRIPNKFLMTIIILFCLWSIAQDRYAFVNHIAIAAAFVLSGIILTNFKIMGAGDSKLLATVSLWFSGIQIIKILLIMAIIGGILAILTKFFGLSIHNIREKLWNVKLIERISTPVFSDIEAIKTDVTFDRYHNMAPYGIAIAIATILVFYTDIIRW